MQIAARRQAFGLDAKPGAFLPAFCNMPAALRNTRHRQFVRICGQPLLAIFGHTALPDSNVSMFLAANQNWEFDSHLDIPGRLGTRLMQVWSRPSGLWPDTCDRTLTADTPGNSQVVGVTLEWLQEILDANKKAGRPVRFK